MSDKKKTPKKTTSDKPSVTSKPKKETRKISVSSTSRNASANISTENQMRSSFTANTPCTSAQSQELERKSSKTKSLHEEEDNDQPIDLSMKRQRIQADTLQSNLYELRPILTRSKKSETNFKGAIIGTSSFRVPQSERPWGTLYFYENKKFVLSYDLLNYEPIRITGQSILGLREIEDYERNVAINYNDWQHAIGKWFLG